MCIIFNDPKDSVQTSDTLLVVSPLATPQYEPQQWQLIYINSVSVASATGRPIMVVALPNPHAMREEEFVLFPVSPSGASTIKEGVDLLETPYNSSLENDVEGHRAPSFGAATSPPLMVQQVGTFKISVAPSLKDLETRAPWAAFNVDPEHAQRVLKDMRAKYSHDFAFVVAEGGQPELPSRSAFAEFKPEVGAKQYGFGVMYRDGRADGCFFPTSHEVAMTATVQMDVTCVALGAIIRPSSILTGFQRASIKMEPIPGKGDSLHWSESPPCFEMRPIEHVVFRGDDSQCTSFAKPKWASVRAILKELPRRGAAGLHASKCVQHEIVSIATIWTLQGQFLNLDVYGRKAVRNEELVVSRLLQDFDVWAAARQSTTGSKDAVLGGAASLSHPGPRAVESSPFGPSMRCIGDSSHKAGYSFDFARFTSNGSSHLSSGHSFGGSVQANIFNSAHGSLYDKPSETTAFKVVPNPFLPSPLVEGGHRQRTEGSESVSEPLNPSLRRARPFANARWNKLDLALAFAGRQITDPGICDRASDAPCPFTGARVNCGPVAYMNLDLVDIDLDAASYKSKRGHARYIGKVDTTGTTYLRISASLGPWESLEQRTV